MSKPKAPEPKKYESKPPQVKIQPKKQTEIQKYFKQLSTKSQSFDKVTKQTQIGQNSILKSIKRGKLQIKQVPNDLGALILKQKIDEDQQKAQQLRRKKQEILQAISKLDMRVQKSNESFKSIGKQYSNPDLLNYKPNSVLTKQQHEALVFKIKQAQQIQDQRNEERLYRLQKQFLEQQENIKKLEQEKLNSQKQLRRRRSEYKLSLRQQINELQNAQELRSKRELLQLKKKNHLHQILQQKYNNTVVIPSLEEKKKKLKQIRQFNKSLKKVDIDQHQKRYLKQRNKSMHLIQSKAKISQEWTYKPPQKTDRLTKILDEQRSNLKYQLNKHQKQVQQKLLREQNYIRLLKQKHVPKLDKNLQDQLSNRIQKLHTKPRQIGIEPRQIGKSYLAEAKKMKKNGSEPTIKAQNEVIENSQLQSSRLNYLVRNEDSHYYAEKRKQQIQKIINSQVQAKQKAKLLEVQNQKIEQAYKRKQQLLKTKAENVQTRKDAAELLLSGIKAKMGLIKLAD